MVIKQNKIMTELTIKKQEIRQYSIDKPAELITLANILKSHIVRQKLYTTIKGRNFAHCDAWQFAGSLLGLTPIVVSAENLSNEREIKWKVTVDILNLKAERIEDRIVGRGIAICSSKENSKKGFDEYAVISMAETRAISKAFRNKIGWIMKLSGMESTPAEEMKSTPTEVEIKKIDTKPATDKLGKAKNQVEIQNIWRTLSQTERNHPDIKDYKDNLMEKYANPTA
jgi:hypothetical protein